MPPKKEPTTSYYYTPQLCFKYSEGEKQNHARPYHSTHFQTHPLPSMMKKQKTAHQPSPIQDLAKRAMQAFPNTSGRGQPPPLHTPPTSAPLKRPHTQMDL